MTLLRPLAVTATIGYAVPQGKRYQPVIPAWHCHRVQHALPEIRRS